MSLAVVVVGSDKKQRDFPDVIKLMGGKFRSSLFLFLLAVFVVSVYGGGGSGGRVFFFFTRWW